MWKMSLAKSSRVGSLLATSPLFLTRVSKPWLDQSTRYEWLTLSGPPQVCLSLIRRTLRLLNASKLAVLEKIMKEAKLQNTEIGN